MRAGINKRAACVAPITMQRFARLQEAVDAWRAAGAEGFVLRHQQQDGGNSFLMFPTRYPHYPYNVAQLLNSGWCVHHVCIAGQPRCCHVDLERVRRPEDTELGNTAELRQVHLAICDVLNSGENAQYYYCQRAGSPKFSVHLNYPSLVFRDEVAERRAMHRVYQLLEERGAPLLPDMAIYRREGKHGLLRAAGTAKPGEPQSFLHYGVGWVHNDPTNVPENATLLERDRFEPLPDEGPAAELEATRFPCPPALSMAFNLDGSREAWLVGVSERTFLLLPHVREPDVLRRWQYDATRPNNWFHLFRALRYSILGNLLFTFHEWWEAYYHLRPGGANSDDRMIKYQDRWDRVMQGPVPPMYTMNMLRRLFRALPRWCPFGGDQCELYCSVHVTRGQDVMLRCLSCQRARLLGPLSCLQHMQLFSKQYVAEQFQDVNPLPATLCINAPMGTGKTTFLKQLLRDHPSWSCVSVTCRRTLASFLVEQLQLRPYGVLNRQGRTAYVDFFRNATERHPARLAIQLESLRRLRQQFRAQANTPLPVVDLLVLDEYQSLMQQFMSETMAHKHREAFEILQWFVQRAVHVVVLDADLMCHGAPWELLQLWRQADLHLRLYLNMRLPNPRKMFRLLEYERAMTLLVQDVRAGEIQLALVATSKLELKSVEAMLREKAPLTSSGSYTSDSQPDDMDQVTRCNDHWPTLQLVAFSPTITVGVSYEGPARRVYLLLGDSSCTPETALQMVGRFRESREVVVVVLPRTKRYHKHLPLTQEQVLAAGDTAVRQYLDHELRALDMETGLFTVQVDDPLTRLLAYGRAQQHGNQSMEQRFRRLVFLHGDELVDERERPRAQEERPDEIREQRVTLRQAQWESLLERCGMPEAKEREQVAQVMGEGALRGMTARDVAYACESMQQLVLWRLVFADRDDGFALERRAELCARGLLYDAQAMETNVFHLLDGLQLGREPLVVARHWVRLARLLRASLAPFEEVRGRDYVLLSELQVSAGEEEYKHQVVDRWLAPDMAAQAQQLGLGSGLLERAGDRRCAARYFEALMRAVGMELRCERPRTAQRREEPRFYLDTERYAYHQALWEGRAAQVYDEENPETPLPLSVAHLY